MNGQVPDTGSPSIGVLRIVSFSAFSRATTCSSSAPLGRDQASSTYTTIVPSATYTFTQGTNVVTIPVSATFAEVRLNFTANTGAPGGQVAELNVNGCPAPNPDLTVGNVTHSPANPLETDAVTLSATVTNAGTAASAALRDSRRASRARTSGQVSPTTGPGPGRRGR